MVEDIPLPLLRQELALFPAPPAEDGTPGWTLHDPPANKFYLLGTAIGDEFKRITHHIGGILIVRINGNPDKNIQAVISGNFNI